MIPRSNTIFISLFGLVILFTIFSSIFLGDSFTSHATISSDSTTYYVSNSGSDSNSGTSEANPWQTIAKINSMSFDPGDKILFKRGDTWIGTLIITSSGNSDNPITYGAYGIGNKPVISGFTDVVDWTNLGGNIWESSNPVSTLNNVRMVVINGENTPMGRYPNLNAANSGYINIISHSGTTSITGSGLSGIDWSGAQLVIRTNQYTIEKMPVTSQSGNTLYYGGELHYEPINGFGFFIQNDIKTLDQQNEWYYNPTTKKIRIYSTSTPSNVKVSSVEQLVLPRANYITFDNLVFQGANEYAFFNDWGIFHNLNIQNSEIKFSGIDGIKLIFSNLTIKNSVIMDSNNIAINLINNNVDVIIRNNTIQNTGTYPGAGINGFGSYYGMFLQGNRIIAEYNKVLNSGYLGIFFIADNILIRNNLVDTHGTILQDGGGIYTYVGASQYKVYTNRTIKDNIVLNGIGAPDGTDRIDLYTEGIYLDGFTMNVDVIGNTVSRHGSKGMLVNSNTNGTIVNNTFYDNEVHQIVLNNFLASPNTIVNITLNNNIFMARTLDQDVFILRSRDENFNVFGNFDNNYYSRPLNDNNAIYTYTYLSGQDWPGISRSLEQWQTMSGQDTNSHISPVSISSDDDLLFLYNPTTDSKTIILNSTYVDVTNESYTGSVIIAPYASKILLRIDVDCVPSNGGVEICDGIDNDCDGVIDNGFAVGDACVSAPNLCGDVNSGSFMCSDDGSSVVCDAVVPDERDVCDVNSSFCGDGIVQSPNSFGFEEFCDGDDLAGESCTSLGFNTGVLSCDMNCSFVVDDCDEDDVNSDNDSSNDSSSGGSSSRVSPVVSTPNPNINLDNENEDENTVIVVDSSLFVWKQSGNKASLVLSNPKIPLISLVGLLSDEILLVNGSAVILPLNESLAPSTDYRLYKHIRLTNISDVIFDELNVSFVVNSSWLSNGSLSDEVVLLYFSEGVWLESVASFDDSSDSYVSRLFSITPTDFLIATKPTLVDIDDDFVTEPVKKHYFFGENTSWRFMLFIFFVIVVFGVLIFGASFLRQRNQKPKVSSSHVSPNNSVPSSSLLRLRSYIDNMIDNDFDHQIIRDNLLNAGWNSKVVDEELAAAYARRGDH